MLNQTNVILPSGDPAHQATIWWSVTANTAQVSSEGPTPLDQLNWAYFRVAAFLTSVPPGVTSVYLWYVLILLGHHLNIIVLTSLSLGTEIHFVIAAMSLC